MDDEKVAYFRASLKEARAEFDKDSSELGDLEGRVFWLKEEIARLRKTITALAALCSETPWSDALGITDSCAEIMELESSEVTTQDVVQRLDAMGFDFSAQKNAAASVHAVLSRMAAKEKIQKVTGDGGAVKWRGPRYSETFDQRNADLAQTTGISDDDIPF